MNNTTLFGRNNVRLTLLTNLLDCHDLSGQSGHLGFEAGNLDFARCILTLCAGIFKSLGSLGLVEVIAADGRISQHSHQIEVVGLSTDDLLEALKKLLSDG